MKTVLRNFILFLLMASMLPGVAACTPKPDPNADTTVPPDTTVAPDTTEQPTESDTPEETEPETEPTETKAPAVVPSSGSVTNRLSGKTVGALWILSVVAAFLGGFIAPMLLWNRE